MKLNLIPKKTIPIFNNLLIQKLYPEFNFENNELFKFEKIIPMIIATIIGDIGLFSKAKSIFPRILDNSIETNAVKTHSKIPKTILLLMFIKIFSLFYYT